MHPDPRDDEALLAERSPAAAGIAFEVFYERHERLIVAFHMRRTGDPELAADLTAETFAQALASRHRFRPNGDDAALRWLYGIAANVLRRSQRTAMRDLRVVHRLGLDRPELNDQHLEAITAAAETTSVLAALGALPAHQREVIRAVVLEGASYSAVAQAEGLAPAAVRKRVSRGLAALRRSLEDAS